MALATLDPANRDKYKKRIAGCLPRDHGVSRSKNPLHLRDVQGKKFMVFLPGMGLADAYGLIQVPIEVEGKEPKCQGAGPDY